MTVEQWLFEYHALRRKERTEGELMVEAMKIGARTFRDILIGVLGLDQVAPKPAGEAAGSATTESRPEGAPPPFVPAAFVMGNHHLLNALMEAADKEKQAEAALNDSAFDEFSRKLAAGEVGDLDPVLTGDAAERPYWQTHEAQEALARMVKPRASDAPAAPHFSPSVPSGQRRGVRIVADGGLPKHDVAPLEGVDDLLSVVPMPGEEA